MRPRHERYYAVPFDPRIGNNLYSTPKLSLTSASREAQWFGSHATGALTIWQTWAALQEWSRSSGANNFVSSGYLLLTLQTKRTRFKRVTWSRRHWSSLHVFRRIRWMLKSFWQSGRMSNSRLEEHWTAKLPTGSTFGRPRRGNRRLIAYPEAWPHGFEIQWVVRQMMSKHCSTWNGQLDQIITMQHYIEIQLEPKPCTHRQYCAGLTSKAAIQENMDAMLQQRDIQPAQNKWRSPDVLVPKRDRC